MSAPAKRRSFGSEDYDWQVLSIAAVSVVMIIGIVLELTGVLK